MNKKGEFTLQSFIVVLVLFIGIVVTFGTFAVTMSGDYEALTGSNVSGAFITTYDQLSAIEGDTETIEENVLGTQTGSTDAAVEFFGDALNTLKVIGTSLSTTKDLMGNMAVSLGISSFWYRILSTVLILMVLTVIIYMIFRYKG